MLANICLPAVHLLLWHLLCPKLPFTCEPFVIAFRGAQSEPDAYVFVYFTMLFAWFHLHADVCPCHYMTICVLLSAHQKLASMHLQGFPFC